MNKLRLSGAVVVLGLLVALGDAALQGHWLVALSAGGALFAAGRLVLALELTLDDGEGDDDGGTEKGDPDEESIAWARGWMLPRSRVKDLEKN